jgi:alanyl-tRNA synthetase
MTLRLYYHEPYRTEFDAQATSVLERDGRTLVVCDRTAFYPTSGGQPHDTGVLSAAGADVRVVDVIDLETGDVGHVVDAPIVPGPVTGRIHWTRRFDHMQQHTGQHVLSAAFDRRFGARTESVHLGVESSTIDLARELSPAEIDLAAAEANRIVWEDRPVAIRFVSEEEAASLPLRKEPTRQGPLRLIDIEDFDLSACGGTHVARTGGIGIIAIAGTERFRGGTRVSFLCGGRVLAAYGRFRDAFGDAQRLLSVAPEEVGTGIEKLQAENKSLQRALRTARESLTGYEASALVERGERVGSRVLVAAALEGRDAAGLKAMAAAAAGEPHVVAVLFSTTQPALAVVARAADTGVDAAAILKALIARFGGKGGGRAELAQGGGLTGRSDELVNAARELLAR